MNCIQIIRACVLSLAASVCTVGCFTKKNPETVESTVAPPPAAYPSSDYASSGGDSPSYAAPAPDAPSSSAYTPPSAPAKPAPFELRGNEQLIPHTIVSGDTLGAIATQYGSSISRIKAANGMTSDRIYAGKVIKVPSAGQPSYASNTTSSSPAPVPSVPSPSVSSPVPSNPAATSYRSPSAGGYTGTDGSTTAPASSSPPTTRPGSAFPSASFGGSSIQFSD